jgi:signal transduction histidine kinase
MDHPLYSVDLRTEPDLVEARRSAREIAERLGLGRQDQIRVATTVSEIARNALLHAGGGSLSFALRPGDAPLLLVAVEDQGPGIADLAGVLAGRGKGRNGLGLAGAQRLMDRCEVRSEPGKGTRVLLHKRLGPAAEFASDASLGALASQVSTRRAEAQAASRCEDELQAQNAELATTLAALNERQDELARLSRELDDTNRGVVALYAELEDQAQQLRRADETKTRFLSNVSHEFRTPLSSIRALAKLMASGVDGELASEHRKQVELILKAVQELSELVDDLLDLAKIQAGRVSVNCSEVQLDELFGALRGTLKPLLNGSAVALHFETDPALAALVTDEPKLTQILRNLVSNALKFTEVGEVRVSCRPLAGEPERVEFTVRDTGIGLAPEHHDWIFEEFAQVEHALQRRHKGTGLGLPLCRKLAHLLGGSLGVESRLGEGACFRLELPRCAESAPLAQPLKTA